MPIGTILLPIDGWELPDGTGTGNLPAILDKRVSTASQTANTPKETFTVALLSGDADRHLMRSFRMPQDYSAGSTLEVVVQFYNAEAQSGVKSTVLKAALKAVTPSIDDVDREAQAFAEIATVSHAFPSGVAARRDRTARVLLSGTALNALASGDDVTLMVGRRRSAADDIAGVVLLKNVSIEYAAA